VTKIETTTATGTGYVAGHLIQTGADRLGITDATIQPWFPATPNRLLSETLHTVSGDDLKQLLDALLRAQTAADPEALDCLAFPPARFTHQSATSLQLLFLASHSLREGLHYLERFGSLLLDNSSIEVTRSREGYIRVRLHVSPTHDADSQRRINELLISNLLGWMIQLCGEDFLPSCIYLNWPDGGQLTTYERHWRTRVHFDASHCMIELPPNSLDEGRYQGHPAFILLLKAEVENQYRRQIRKSSLSGHISQAFYNGQISLNAEQGQVADHYNISARTLNRYLKKEGTSLKQLATQARIAMAKVLLVESNESIHEIAFRLKLSGRRALDRIFLAQEDMTPAQFRAAYRNQ
jgi:AraC-like DNA-binding protein